MKEGYKSFRAYETGPPMLRSFDSCGCLEANGQEDRKVPGRQKEMQAGSEH